MSLNSKEKVHAIIHSAAVSAAAVGGGLAQIPGSDSTLIVPIQTAMVISIANIRGRKISGKEAMKFIAPLAGKIVGRKISQILIGWIPGWGNAINAATAAALTEAIGWSVHAMFSEE